LANSSIPSQKTKNSQGNNKVPGRYLIALLLILFLVSLLTVISHYDFIKLNNVFLMIMRWVAITGIIGYAMYKKSLTTWILISMIVGAEFGTICLISR
jgi:NAD/NADP transhydrogenase beta subunit